MLVQSMLDLLAPPACASCRRLPRRGDLLCRGCRVALPWLGGPLCDRCGLPAPCGRSCPAAGMAFERAWAPLAYGGAAAALVIALKERGALPAASVMAGQIAATAPDGLLAAGALVPVPADPVRQRRRGLDHAAVLASQLSARRGLRVARVLRRRPSRAGRQAGARRAQRLCGERIAVRLRGAPPEVAILVDDVHTTGATLHACALALRSGGTRKVIAVSYARTLPSGNFGRTFDGT